MDLEEFACVPWRFLHAGVVKSSPMMLVMEIAALGPLHKFLRKHKRWVDIVSIMMSVCVRERDVCCACGLVSHTLCGENNPG